MIQPELKSEALSLTEKSFSRAISSIDAKASSQELDIEKIEVELLDKPSQGKNLKHYEVSFVNGKGEVVTEPKVYSVEHRRDSALDMVVPIIRGEVGVKLVSFKSPCPSCVAHSQITEPSFVDKGQENGLALRLINVDLDQAALSKNSPLFNRTKLVEKNSAIRLASTLSSSLGGSTEHFNLDLVEVYEPPHLLSNQDSTEQSWEAHYHSPQEIVDGYLKGEIHDTGLILAAFMTAEREGEALTISNLIESTVTLANNKVSSRDDLRKLVVTKPKDLESLCNVEISNCEKPQSSFLEEIRVKVTNIRKNPELNDSYETSLVVRRGVDAVDDLAYCFNESGEICMPLKRGLRPNAVVQGVRKNPLMLEGPAGCLEGETTKKEIENRALAELREEINLDCASEAKYIGYQYPSPRNPERAYQVAIEVDPNSSAYGEQSIEETVDTCWARVKDIIALGHEGVLADARLLTTAYLLKTAAQSITPKRDVRLSSFTNLEGKIGVFGGTFNPIQDGHIKAAELAMTQHDLDSVVFIPNKQSPLKEPSEFLSTEKRVLLLEGAISNNPNFHLSMIELNDTESFSYTATTLAKIRSELPASSKLFMIAGADTVMDFDRWDHIDRVFELSDGIITIPRNGLTTEKFDKLLATLSPDKVEMLKRNCVNEAPGITSSTEVRAIIEKARAGVQI